MVGVFFMGALGETRGHALDPQVVLDAPGLRRAPSFAIGRIGTTVAHQASGHVRTTLVRKSLIVVVVVEALPQEFSLRASARQARRTTASGAGTLVPTLDGFGDALVATTSVVRHSVGSANENGHRVTVATADGATPCPVSARARRAVSSRRDRAPCIFSAGSSHGS